MTYRHTRASLAASPAGALPKQDYISLFQQTLDDNFYNSSDWWTVQEEDSIGSRQYQEVDVRINHVINAETGLKLGDDWKTVLFKDVDHSTELGRIYLFDNNTWLTVNTEAVKNLTATCTIRRCNNSLRWIDEATGAYYEEPCCIEYMVKEPRDYMTSGSPFTTPGGFLHIEMQFNPITNKIKQNQRFLFGNPGHWTCYKVIGTGLNDFRNQITYDETSARILTVDLIANFVNDELDDVVNGIADVYTNVYAVSLNMSHIEGSAGETVQLIPSVTYNGNSVTRTMSWVSSDTDIATVSQSGLVTLVSNGNCTITANVLNNPAAASCTVSVLAIPAVNKEIKISPNTNYLLEGASRTYTVYLYEDGVQQADTFTITCLPNAVTAASYTFAQATGNSFTLTNNLRSVTSYLTIHCVGAGAEVRDFHIYLRGAW